MIKNKQNSEHYFWGEKCEGWHFLNSSSLSVIEELMLPNTKEKLHFHKNAEQFFYILKGSATFSVEDENFVLKEQEGIRIKPNKKHQIKNLTDQELRFLVISSPKVSDDRFEV